MATSNRLFVYGTLRRGFSLNRLLRESGARFTARGKIRARLFDLGEYPGAAPALNSTDFVEGEIYQLNSPAKQLAILDEAEEFDQRHPNKSLFKRRLVDVHLENGRRQRA